MKIVKTLLLGSLLAFSTSVLAEQTNLKCSTEYHSFTYSENGKTRDVLVTFLDDGEKFSGKGLIGEEAAYFHAVNSTNLGDNQIVIKLNKADLTFLFKQQYNPSTEAINMELSPFYHDETGVCQTL